MNDFDIFFDNSFRLKFEGNVKADEPMVKHTTMRVGGIAPIFLEPKDENSLVFAIKFCKEKNMPYFVLGGGSNVIIDENINFVIISTKSIQEIKIIENEKKSSGLYQKIMNKDSIQLHFSSGLNWGRVCSFCRDNKIIGFEKFAGLPGTVGGAIFMNATCFGFSTVDNLVCVKYFDLEDMEIKTYQKNIDDWGYKKSPFQKNKIVLSAIFDVKKDESKSSEEMKELYKKALDERASKGHFSAPSAGSVFKNLPEQNIIAGKIIDECNLKGTKIGGASIADFHGNFIINKNGDATSKDIRDLVQYIKKVVQEKKDINLSCEIIFVPQNADN